MASAKIGIRRLMTIGCGLCLILFYIQAFRERMVPATPGHARSAAVARLGRLHSDVLSSSRREGLVAVAKSCVRGGVSVFRCEKTNPPRTSFPPPTYSPPNLVACCEKPFPITTH